MVDSVWQQKNYVGRVMGHFPNPAKAVLIVCGGYSPDTNDQPEAIKKKMTSIIKYIIFVI